MKKAYILLILVGFGLTSANAQFRNSIGIDLVRIPDKTLDVEYQRHKTNWFYTSFKGGFSSNFRVKSEIITSNLKETTVSGVFVGIGVGVKAEGRKRPNNYFFTQINYLINPYKRKEKVEIEGIYGPESFDYNSRLFAHGGQLSFGGHIAVIKNFSIQSALGYSIYFINNNNRFKSLSPAFRYNEAFVDGNLNQNITLTLKTSYLF